MAPQELFEGGAHPSGVRPDQPRSPRAEAFGAWQHVLTRMKEDVPIWKREEGPDGSSWVSERP